MSHTKQSFLKKKLIFWEEAIGFLFKRKFSDTSLKKPKLNYVSTFIYDNAKDKFFGSELQQRIKLTKTSK